MGGGGTYACWDSARDVGRPCGAITRGAGADPSSLLSNNHEKIFASTCSRCVAVLNVMVLVIARSVIISVAAVGWRRSIRGAPQRHQSSRIVWSSSSSTTSRT